MLTKSGMEIKQNRICFGSAGGGFRDIAGAACNKPNLMGPKQLMMDISLPAS